MIQLVSQNAIPIKPLREKKIIEDKTNRKFWTPELRQELCRAFCEHIAKGYSNESFRGYKSEIARGEFLKITYKTIQSYMKDYKEDFPSEWLESAESERLYFWETMGISGTAGKLKGFNSRSWEFNMQNRFKWRIRSDHTTDDKPLEPNIIYLPRETGANAKE